MTEPVVFLPGILMPAAARYVPLRAALTDGRETVTKELEVYAGAEPPPGYSLQMEVDGLHRFADQHDFERFHLYGHSAGGAIGLAYVAAHPDRLLSLALDEAASDFSDEDRAAIAATVPDAMGDLPVSERMAGFARSLLRDGVEPPPPPPPTDAAEMSKRPAGLVAFLRALEEHRLDGKGFGAFDGPVYYSYGTLSNERWEAMAKRLDAQFRRCTVERFDGIHHLNTSHQAEPERVARSLQRLWADAEGSEASL